MEHRYLESAATVQSAVQNIVRLYENYGVERYESGMPESVSQLEHALQCAMLAESAGADECLITAALLHDVGHLLYDDGEFGASLDDEHQDRAMIVLAPLFPVSVLEPVRLHVQAKRYLCLVEPGYYDGLSEASRRSLALQGGVFAPGEGERFIEQPHASDAVLLRRWDDRAKTKGRETPPLDHFLDFARRALAPCEAVTT